MLDIHIGFTVSDEGIKEVKARTFIMVASFFRSIAGNCVVPCKEDNNVKHVSPPLKRKIWANDYFNIAVFKGSAELQDLFSGVGCNIQLDQFSVPQLSGSH